MDHGKAAELEKIVKDKTANGKYETGDEYCTENKSKPFWRQVCKNKCLFYFYIHLRCFFI
jgi:hypothetical protein